MRAQLIRRDPENDEGPEGVLLSSFVDAHVFTTNSTVTAALAVTSDLRGDPTSAFSPTIIRPRRSLQHEQPEQRSVCLHKCSLVLHVVLFILSFVEVILAGWWMHIAGILIGVAGLAVSALGACLWHVQFFYAPNSTIKYFLRPLFLLTRMFLLVAVVAFLSIHALSPDKLLHGFPNGCRVFSGQDNCTRVVNNQTIPAGARGKAARCAPPSARVCLARLGCLFRVWNAGNVDLPQRNVCAHVWQVTRGQAR